MSLQTKRFLVFGDFRLDRKQRVLLLGNEVVALPPKAFDTLLVLVEGRDRVVGKDELMKAVWPDSFVEEGNLTQNVFLIRRALGDSQRYVVTVAGKGYRFTADVADADETDLTSSTKIPQGRSPSASVASEPSGSRRWLRAVVLAIVVFEAAILGGGYLLRQSSKPRALVEAQITSNASEASLNAAAISPDGKYLAYADDHGIYLRSTANGENHALTIPPGLRGYRLSWFPDGSKLLVSGIDEAQRGQVLSVSLAGGEVRALRKDGADAVASPDGNRILFTASSESEIWVMGTNGEDARRILAAPPQSTFTSLGWLPDGEHILYEKSSVVVADSIESCNLNGTEQKVVVSGPGGLLHFVLLPGGRLLYTVPNQSGQEAGTNLWEVKLDLREARAIGGTRLVKEWKDAIISALSATEDGKRVAYLRGLRESDVYVGELEEGGARVLSPRRLTLDDRDDQVSGWTADSKSVLFASNRSGTFDIFRQSLDEPSPHVLVESRQMKIRPRSTPDGAAILYFDPPGIRSYDEMVRLSRVPIDGGPPQEVMHEQALYTYRCASRPGKRCVVGVMSPKELIVSELDPWRGKGAELVRIATDPAINSPNLDLSPDGSRIAVVAYSTASGLIDVISLSDGSKHPVAVKGWSDLNYVTWSADGAGWYVSSENGHTSTLLYVDAQGNARVLLRQPGGYLEIWGIPSPDGKHLAWIQYNSGNNAWTMENF